MGWKFLKIIPPKKNNGANEVLTSLGTDPALILSTDRPYRNIAGRKDALGDSGNIKIRMPADNTNPIYSGEISSMRKTTKKTKKSRIFDHNQGVGKRERRAALKLKGEQRERYNALFEFN